MPEVITTSITVYRFEELSTSAQSAAVEAIAAKLGGDWWDSFDTDRIGETIRYSLAASFKTPGHDTYGCGDFPGIPNVTVEAWDLDRGQYLSVKGTLDRDNAPGLPWVDPIGSVDLTAARYGTDVEVMESEGRPCTCAHGGWESTHDAGCPELSYVPMTTDEVEAISTAVTDALHTAWVAGRDEMEYIGGEQNARDWIDANEPRFTEAGNLHR